MKDYYTIHEFSVLSGVEASRLRYYDEIGLFSPIKRNPKTNYRYYSLPQIFALNFIAMLSDLDVPLKTIAELRRERSPEKLLKLLEEREKQLDMEMYILRQRYSIIHARRELINYGMVVTNGFRVVDGKRVSNWDAGEDGIKVDETMISVLYRERKEVIIWPLNKYLEGETFIEPLVSFVSRAGEKNINLSFPVGGYYENMDSFLNAPSKPERFFTIDPLGTHMHEEGYYLTGFARGDYGEMGDLPERMTAYADENSLAISGPVYAVYLFDEISVQDSSRFLVQACVAVKGNFKIGK